MADGLVSNILDNKNSNMCTCTRLIGGNKYKPPFGCNYKLSVLVIEISMSHRMLFFILHMHICSYM